MRIKIYLNTKRDLELIALRFNPALDFGGIAREILRSHVRSEKYVIPQNNMGKYMKRSLTCYITLDDAEDADVIEYLNHIIISKSAFIRNIMLRSIGDDIDKIYIDDSLKAMMISYDVEKKQKAAKKKLRMKMETRATK